MDTPIIPGYDILAPLPQGGMSAVFKARQISLDRVVVLKLLPPSMAADSVDIEKFMAEARITAQLKHPNIVQVYDFGKSTDGSYYFVMEYVSGYSVAQWVQRKKCLSIKDTLLCAHCVAEALSYAWSAFGIVHCDIKPDNIMIDGDGTVKVADLGLARSVRSVMDKAKSHTGIVVGTPHYISPEQSQGLSELDCRADIYSLGAMLYHCLTGKLPFEGLPLLEIMDCQITDQIQDVAELQPQTSMAVACLIEKMMAKNPGHRQKDWPEVIRDMIRARSEIIPSGPMPPENASTMKRCAARTQYLKDQNSAAHAKAKPPATPPAPPGAGAKPRQWLKPEWLAAVIMIIALAVPSLLVLNMLKTKSGAMPRDRRQMTDAARPSTNSDDRSGVPAAETEASAKQASLVEQKDLAKKEALAQSRLDAAAKWCKDNPSQFNEGIRQYAQIAVEMKGTRYAQDAQSEIAVIRERKNAAMAAEMKALYSGVQPLLDRQKWQEAANLVEQYNGQFKAETAKERKGKVDEWREQDRARKAAILKSAEAQKLEQNRRWRGVLDEIAGHLVEGNTDDALAIALQATNNAALAANRTNLLMLTSMLSETDRAEQRLLDSFRLQKDQEVVVALTKGPEHLVVRDVQDDAILVEKIIVVSSGQIGQSKVIRLQDLATDEKMIRLGTNQTPGTALVHGVVALRDGNWELAEASWSQAGPLLSAPLLAKLQERKNRQRELAAKSDFIMLLRSACVEVGDKSGSGASAPSSGASNESGRAATQRMPQPDQLPGCEVCLAAIGQKKYSPQMARVLANSVTDYQEKYGLTEFAKAYAPALAALKQAPVIVAESNVAASAESLTNTVSAEAADSNAMRKELLARNPGLAEYNISIMPDKDGKIVRVELVSADLKDISPLAGLPDLRAVVCAATSPDDWRESPAHAPLYDLTPLKGLPLEELCVRYTRVRDLAPLAEMPLKILDLTGTRVTDFSILKGMPLRELTLSHLNIRDLTLVRGMELEKLNLHATRVKDLNPLRDMPLKWLDISDTDVRDLAPLRYVPLKGLTLWKTPVRDLSPIQNSPIEEIWLDYNISQQMPAETSKAFTTVLVHMPRLQKINGKLTFQERRWRE